MSRRAGWVGGLGAVALGVLVATGPASAASGGWSPIAGPAPGAANDTLNAVAAASTGDAWAVGIQFTAPDANLVSAHPLALRWNGAQWAQTSTPSVSSNQALFGVGAASATDAWAVGRTSAGGYRAGLPLALHWDGTSWSAAATAPNIQGTLSAVADLGPANAWAVGTLGRSGQLIEHWDGTAWSTVAAPLPAPTGTVAPLTAISARGANDIWAVGRFTSVDGDGAYALHWDGVSWTSSLIQPALLGPSALTPASVVAVGPNDVWVVANPQGTGNPPVIEHWNGTAWSVSPSPGLGDYPTLTGVTARSATDVWAVGNILVNVNTPNPQPRTESLHWDGGHWSVVPVSDTAGTLSAVTAAPGSQRLWTVGTIQSSAFIPFIFTRSS